MPLSTFKFFVKNMYLNPRDLDPPATRSLCLMFLLQELLFLFEHPENATTDKLCFYCELLLQTSKIDHKSLLQELEAMQTYLLQLRFQKTPSESSLQPYLQKIFSGLIPFLTEARADENVLMVLIENIQAFNQYLGKRFIEILLQSFFPQGPSHLRAMIYEGFTRRGFSSFLLGKEQILEALDWEISCPATHT